MHECLNGMKERTILVRFSLRFRGISRFSLLLLCLFFGGRGVVVIVFNIVMSPCPGQPSFLAAG